MRRFASAAMTLIAFTGLTLAQPKPAAPTGNIYKRTIKSCVWVFSPLGGGKARTGSGTLIDVKDRLVITNYHVVGDDTDVYILFPILDKAGNPHNERQEYVNLINSGKAPKGKVIAVEKKRDLALVQVAAIPKDTPAVRISKDGVGPSDAVHCIGNSGASAGLFDYCKGDVRNVAQLRAMPKGSDKPFELNARMIEHTAPVNQGQSGGPVLNDAGDLVGVTQGHALGENVRGISLAVDLSEVKDFLKANKYARLLNAPPTAIASAVESPKSSTPAGEPDAKADAAKQENAAAGKLSFAKEFISAGKKDKARERLEDILKNYPTTKAAAEAKTLLESLK
jgi:S1-C subfamily serine protease